MQTGDLVLFRGTDVVSWTIRNWTKSSWAHVGALWVVADVPLVIEARRIGGVSCHALANRQDDAPTVFPVGRPFNIDLALLHLGDHYSTKDALLAGLGDPGDHAGWECAEFMAACYGLPANKGWTPQSLADTLLK